MYLLKKDDKILGLFETKKEIKDLISDLSFVGDSQYQYIKVKKYESKDDFLNKKGLKNYRLDLLFNLSDYSYNLEVNQSNGLLRDYDNISFYCDTSLRNKIVIRLKFNVEYWKDEINFDKYREILDLYHNLLNLDIGLKKKDIAKELINSFIFSLDDNIVESLGIRDTIEVYGLGKIKLD